MFVTNWISTTKIQKISEITNFFRHYFLSRTEVLMVNGDLIFPHLQNSHLAHFTKYLMLQQRPIRALCHHYILMM